jgi:hypothetical protein
MLLEKDVESRIHEAGDQTSLHREGTIHRSCFKHDRDVVNYPAPPALSEST